MISFTHLFLQVNLAQVFYLAASNAFRKDRAQPNVGITVPAYEEDYETLAKTVASCLDQDYTGKTIVVLVDDGSKDRNVVSRIAAKYTDRDNFLAIFHLNNQGKRVAHKTAFDYLAGKVDLIATVDSDTMIAPTAVRFLVQRFNKPGIGAATGHVRVANSTTNLLTRLIGVRYWFAFHLERAAQSVWGAVLCCSGALAIYRADIIERVKDRYIDQKFLGVSCTYGDDRHLTNLVLQAGYQVHFEPRADSWTVVPDSLPGWIKQQVRWNKSYYRETGWTIKNILLRQPRLLPAYVVFDLIAQGVMPFLLLFALAISVYRTMTGGVLVGLLYLTTLLGVALLRSIVAYWRLKDRRFFIFPLYGFLHLGLLIPLRLYAILSLKKMGWGTR